MKDLNIKDAPLNNVGNNSTDHCINDAGIAESVVKKLAPSYDTTFIKSASSDNASQVIKKLPIWGLPKDLQNIISQVSKGYQCHRDFAVASMFAAAATMLGKKVSSKFNNHVNYPSLWIVIVGRTSAGKSAPMSFMFNPIDELEKASYERYVQETREWKASNKIGETPIFKHLIINDVSDESVLLELSRNPSLCWKCDELSTLFEQWGRYSKSGGGVIIGHLLSIFNYYAICIMRALQDPKYIVSPCMTITGGIQPHTLKTKMSGKGHTEDGLLQRFLFVYPEYTGVPEFFEAKISDEIVKLWAQTVDRLSHVQETTLEETDEARSIHIDAINMWRSERNECYRDNEAMDSLLSKLEIHLCRLSILVAVLRNEKHISADTMRYTIQCMEYFKYCGERIFCLVMGNSPQSMSKKNLFKTIIDYYPSSKKSVLADALGISRQALNGFING